MATASRESGSSTIGRGTTVRGSVRGDGHVEVLGRIDGSIDVSGDVTIGDGALIKSDVSARNIVIRGAVAGNVTAQLSLVLEAGARVVGDLAAPTIGIRPGALVRGNVSSGGGVAPVKKAIATAVATSPAVAAAAKRPDSVPVRERLVPAPQPRLEKPAVPARPAVAVAAKPVAAAASMRAEPARPQGAPPPIVPALQKGAKATLRRKTAR